MDPPWTFSGACALKHSFPTYLICGCHTRLLTVIFSHFRKLEAEIFQLGIRLEELKDHLDQSQQEPEPAGSDSAQDSPPARASPYQPACLPPPLGQAPIPATPTLCPEVLL